MPAPRLSQSAEAARAAAQQAEFNEKKWVWIPDEKEGYLAGWVHSEDDEMGQVVIASGGEIRTVPLYTLNKMNPPKFDRVEDIADLTFLNEASVVHNLRLRYGSGAIYTYSGLFLVAINPYQSLPLYSDAIIQQYRSKRRDENPPHIFAVAERAWVNMGDERENQSILITGESGAGKTESTKKVIQYLAAIATDAHAPSHSRSPTLSSSSVPAIGLPRSASMKKGHSATPSSSSGFLNSKGRLGLLERQILQANPILEAFGNAQTQRNNNSSRFGKFVRISFAPDGSIAGANIDWYLLEKSRVVVRSEAERNFHVFYQLMAGGGSLRDKLLLGGEVEDYEFLNKSRREVDGVDDIEEWKALQAALDVVGFSPVEQFDLFRIVAAILHIGNIEITSTRADDAVMPDPSQAERVCHLLGIPVAEFTRAVLRPRVLAGREWVTQARTRQQALDELAALSKTLYEKSFGSLVDRINEALDRPSSKSTFIGVLDIAGFEIFEINTYEQLLINYTNEKLQQFFNHHMFVLEQEEYAREGIKWDYVNFGLDLQPTIDLIESTGGSNGAIGILSCLDEECIMPKATDLTFTNKLHSLWPTTGGPEDKYVPSRFEQGFMIRHYAADVQYRTDGWLEKNKDPLNDNLTRILALSTERYVATLFAEYSDAPSGPGGPGNMFTIGKKRGIKKGAFRTVAQRHKEQLASLMAQLQATQPHFVRCIVPNGNKKPGRMDVPLVLDQLRCNGVLEGIRIARLGYPNRLPFVEFRQRYEVLTPGIIPRGYMDGREACRRIVKALELDEAVFKIGTSKIFFKAGVLAELEERRDQLLFDIFSRLQATARMWTARRQMKKILHRAVAIRTIQRNARVYGDLRDWPWWQLYTKVRPLLAATRNDEELRRKEAELALIKERAERDKQERETLEALKMSLEAEKRRVEDELEAERSLALDKDTLLERSKKREVELEDEIAEYQGDIEALESQLARVMKMQKDSDEKHKDLRQMFDQAADHLVRLESEQNEWKTKEADLTNRLNVANQEIEALHSDIDQLQKVGEDLKSLAMQREEDIQRTKDRSDLLIKDLEGKLEIEQRNRELTKTKTDTLEQEARQVKEQFTEMTRTANQYSGMIQKKEDQIKDLTEQLELLQQEHDAYSKEIIALQSDIETLAAELEAEKEDGAAATKARMELQKELDELRDLMARKTSEETRRNEVEKSKEAELTALRTQSETLQKELAESRRLALENQGKLKAEAEQRARELSLLQDAHNSILERERSSQARLKEALASLADLEKQKRSIESELQSVRTRQSDTDSQLIDAQRAKEGLERQLAASLTKYHNIEDLILQTERETKASEEGHKRQLETYRKRLDKESAACAQLEKDKAAQKAELTKLQSHISKTDAEIKQLLKDLSDRQWEVKQLEAKQDKTIVEHVHVLEEAKRVTDRQLADAQAELQRNAAYIRSLEQAKARLTAEAQDLTRMSEREQLELRSREKNARTQETKATQARVDAEKERQAKELAELQSQRLQNELKSTSLRIEELEQQLSSVQRSKTNLENELDRIANETIAPNSMAKLQRQYESRIAELEAQLDGESSSISMGKLRERIQHQHAEIRQLVLNSGPVDSAFRTRLLRELQSIDDEFGQESQMSSHQPRSVSNNHIRSMANLPSSKRNSSAASSKDSVSESGRTSEQVTALRQQVQVLEIKIAASDRVRQHLESSLQEMVADLEKSDGSKQSLQQHRARLAKENARLKELLAEEADARRTAETAQVDGVQAMWIKFQNAIDEERKNYARLEESRKALHVQQQTSLTELETQRNQLRELTQARTQLQAEVSDLQKQLAGAKTELSGTKRQLQRHLHEEELSSSASDAATSELRTAIESYQTKEKTYQKNLENAEIERAKAARAEALMRKSLAELERKYADATAERNALDEKRRSAEQTVQVLQTKLADDGRESSDLVLLNQRLAEELEDLKNQHQKDLENRDFANDQTRKKYQAEFAQLSEELQAQRDTISRLREENRKIRSDYDELQLTYDDEVYKYNSSGAKKEKERLEMKIADVTKAFEASSAAQAEQQAQIVALHSQVRELRAVLDDAEADRALLQKARRALQSELDSIKLENVDTNKMSTDREFQLLQLEKQDLERSLEEQEDRVANAFDRMKRAEAFANECQVELGKIRVDNSELDRLNANLEKQVKELNLRIVDLETKSLASSPRATISRRHDSRIEEITSQLQGSSRLSLVLPPGEVERQRAKYEEERKAYDAQVASLRESMNLLQSEQSALQSAKRRAEREAADYKQKVLSLERELDRLRSRVEPRYPSPASSPRK